MNWTNAIRGLFVCCVAAAMAGASVGAAAPAAKAPAPAAKKPSPFHRPANSHVKAPATPATPARAGAKGKAQSKKKPTVLRGHRHVSRLHRAAGTISGVVRDAKGSTVGAAKVRLAKPNGRPIRNARARHGTSTDSSGHYTMRGVKAGRYRVVAGKKGIGGGHAAVGMKAGGAHRKDVKLNGKAKAKRRATSSSYKAPK